ncbi:hypothetical protein SAMN05518861_12744 [Mesorhizobium sp. YR577]|nr:hypothetical protein SAMN05518861_12744 [Mesorhizobium sp. YR577]
MTLLNFVPIELQRRIIDVAVANRDVRTLLLLGALYLSVLILYSGVKYVLMIYQGWVGESAVKAARDSLLSWLPESLDTRTPRAVRPPTS